MPFARLTTRVGLLVVLLLPNGCDDRDNPGRDSPPPASRVADDSASVPQAPSGGSAQESAGAVLHADGWGPIRIGMTRAQVVAALGEDAHPEAVGGPDPAQCDEFRPRGAPPGMMVMIERGLLTRITLTSDATIRTDAGVRVGDSAAAVETEYGQRLTATPHQYLAAPARYLIVWHGPPAAERARGIAYVIDTEERVSRIHAGARSIAYVEGCV